MSRVLVLGNATLDIVQRVDRLPVCGETLLGAAPSRCAGGKGLNQAIAAARVGADVDFVAAVGADAEGAALRATMAGEGLRDVAWIDADAPTDLSVIWVDRAGRNMIVSSFACAAALDPDRAACAARRLAPGDWLLMQGNLTRAATLAAAAAARGRGARVAINAAPIAFDFTPVLAQCDLLIVNEVEATMLSNVGEPRDAARRLARHAQVVLTLGAGGACLFDDDGVTVAPAAAVEAVDTAGAGDVLAGTLVGLSSQGMPMASALRIAVAAASLSVTRPGTSPSFPSRDELAALRNR